MARRRMPPGQPKPAARNARSWLFPILLIAVAVWSYSTSFRGAFVGDDLAGIVNNPHIRSLWPPSVPLTSPKETTLAGRPVVSLSFAVNYALAPAAVRETMTADPSGRPDDPFYENVWGYHAVNLLVHILAGLALFGVVRRTLLTQPLRDRYARASAPLAFAVAVVWLAHPLQTSAVTFLVQRAESLMGLLYLTTLYCTIRAAESDFQSRAWIAAAIIVCAFGMATKEAMATAPFMVMLWIWVFCPGVRLFGPPRRLLLGLAATLVVVPIVATGARTSFIGFNIGGWTWWTYLESQGVVISRYIRLAFWPRDLVFNYVWFPVRSWFDVAPQFVAIAALGLASAFALFKRRPVGFLGAWFFLILAPTSSILPFPLEVAAEFRMYLPLAAIIAAVVLATHAASHWITVRSGARARRPAWWPAGGWVVLGIITVALGVTTRGRSHDYDSIFSITADTLAKQPDYAEVRMTHGMHLIALGRFAEAETEVRTALSQPLPPYVDQAQLHAAMHMALGVALKSQGKIPEGISELEQALALRADLSLASGALVEVLLAQRRPREAVAVLERAFAAHPDEPLLLAQAAWILATSSDDATRNGARAIEFAEKAARLTNAQDPVAIDTLAAAYAETGQFDQAVAAARDAITLATRSNGGLLSIVQAHLALFQAKTPIRTQEW